MKALKFAVLASIAILSIASCKKDDKKNEENSGCGSTPWFQDGQRLAYKNYPILFKNDSLIVTLKKIGENRFQSQSELGAAGMGSFQEVCGTKAYQASDANFSDRALFYDLAAEIGTTWKVETATTQGIKAVSTVTMQEKNVTVKVPAGTYTAYVLKVQTSLAGNEISSAKMYVTPKHGIVKFDGTTAHYELGTPAIKE